MSMIQPRLRASTLNMPKPFGNAGNDAFRPRPRWRLLCAMLMAFGAFGALGCDEEPLLVRVPIPAGTTPERKTLHRINRAEYTNSIRALFYGLETDAAEAFPADEPGVGFDNIANLLSLSPIVVQLLEDAAHRIVDQALFRLELDVPDYLIEVDPEEITATVGELSGLFWKLTSNGSISSEGELEDSGVFELSARVACIHSGAAPCKVALRLNDIDILVTETDRPPDNPKIITAKVTVTAGPQKVSVAFLNDPLGSKAGERDLLVEWMRLQGPIDSGTVLNPIREKILGLCTESDPGGVACLREITTKFGKRAWRRPLTRDEIDGFMDLSERIEALGGNWEDQLSAICSALIISPDFLFRVELDQPDPTSLKLHLLNDYELASRLAYFLWSSMPDAELLTLADQGALQNPGTIAMQVERMLKDPQAQALADNFMGQWLLSRRVAQQAPNPESYPAFDDALQAAQVRELDLFMAKFIFEDRSMLELLTDPITSVNRRLAEHYGLPLEGLNDAFVAVDLTGTKRLGLLGKSGLMTVLSHPTRTSPVKRGVWVLDALLCDGPGDPPPGVEGLLDKAEPTGKTLRELMEAHRTDPYCASCHSLFDPIGLGLENFDGIGAWRTLDNGLPVDPSGELPGGIAFSGPVDLVAHLSDDPRFSACISRKLFIYAMGRDVADVDAGYLTLIDGAFATGGFRFQALAQAIATSDAFRMRRGEPSSSTAGGTP